MRNVLVECLSGHEFAERPIAVSWQGERLELAEILAEWRTPQEKWFRVRAATGQVFELCYTAASDQWSVRLI